MSTRAAHQPEGPLTLQSALAWIADVLNEPESQVTSGTLRADLPRWDSLGQLLLLAALDQQFGIKLTPPEVSSLTSVRSILRVLERRQCLIGTTTD